MNILLTSLRLYTHIYTLLIIVYLLRLSGKGDNWRIDVNHGMWITSWRPTFRFVTASLGGEKTRTSVSVRRTNSHKVEVSIPNVCSTIHTMRSKQVKTVFLFYFRFFCPFFFLFLIIFLLLLRLLCMWFFSSMLSRESRSCNKFREQFSNSLSWIVRSSRCYRTSTYGGLIMQLRRCVITIRCNLWIKSGSLILYLF